VSERARKREELWRRVLGVHVCHYVQEVQEMVREEKRERERERKKQCRYSRPVPAWCSTVSMAGEWLVMSTSSCMYYIGSVRHCIIETSAWRWSTVFVASQSSLYCVLESAERGGKSRNTVQEWTYRVLRTCCWCGSLMRRL
jgi:hypothetical protein